MMSKRSLCVRAAGALACALLLAACQTTPAPGHAGLTAAQVAALEQEGFHLVDDGMQKDLSGRLLFAVNSANTTPENKAVVAKITNVLLTVGVNRVRLDGHTDNQGSEQYNLDLSKERAEAVAAAMEDSGFNAAWIQVRGLGPLHPVADNSTEEGRATNRRVSVIVSSVQ